MSFVWAWRALLRAPLVSAAGGASLFEAVGAAGTAEAGVVLRGRPRRFGCAGAAPAVGSALAGMPPWRAQYSSINFWAWRS